MDGIRLFALACFSLINFSTSSNLKYLLFPIQVTFNNPSFIPLVIMCFDSRGYNSIISLILYKLLSLELSLKVLPVSYCFISFPISNIKSPSDKFLLFIHNPPYKLKIS